MKKLFLLIASLILIIGIAVPSFLGYTWQDYNFTANYLSELGATGAPTAYQMNMLGFLPFSILWALALFILHRILPKGPMLTIGVLLLLGTSVSYAGAVVFPCDMGCPLEGSENQLMHNALGIIGYLTAPPGLLVLGIYFFKQDMRFSGILSFIAAILTLTGFLFLASPETVDLRGAWQRLADFSLMIWMFIIAITLKDPTQRR